MFGIDFLPRGMAAGGSGGEVAPGGVAGRRSVKRRRLISRSKADVGGLALAQMQQLLIAAGFGLIL